MIKHSLLQNLFIEETTAETMKSFSEPFEKGTPNVIVTAAGMK